MKKKLLALTMILTMALGTIVNAQEMSGEGFGSVPVGYQASSSFTVVLPDSIDLDSTKTQEFEIYLKDYDLVGGDAVRVKPINNTFTMEAEKDKIAYYVGEDANSCIGFPEFPTYYKGSGSSDFYYLFKDYILTKQNNNYYLYGVPKGDKNNTRLYSTSQGIVNTIEYRIQFEGNYIKYKDKEGTLIDTNKDIQYLNQASMPKYMFNKEINEWEKTGTSGFPNSNEIIVQSTLPIYNENTDKPFIQYSKEVKDPVEVIVSMPNTLLTDDTHVSGFVDGTQLTSGNWSGEVLFEITLE